MISVGRDVGRRVLKNMETHPGVRLRLPELRCDDVGQLRKSDDATYI